MSGWYYWIIVPLALAGSGGALALLSMWTMRSYRRLEDGMRELAAERGARFRESRAGCLPLPSWALGMTPGFSIVERRDGVEAVLAYEEEWMGRVVTVSMTCAARLAEPTEMTYSLRPSDLFDTVRRFLGNEEVSFEDDAFSSRYVVNGDDPAGVRKLLDGRRRRVLRDTLEGSCLECDGNVVVLQVPSEVIGDLWKADAVLDLVLELAAAPAGESDSGGDCT